MYIVFNYCIVNTCFCRQLSVLVDYHKRFSVRFTVLKEVMQRISDNYSMLPIDVPLWVCMITIVFQYQYIVNVLLMCIGETAIFDSARARGIFAECHAGSSQSVQFEIGR